MSSITGSVSFSRLVSIFRVVVPVLMTGIAMALVAVFVDLDQLLTVLGGVRPGFVAAIALVAASMIALTVPRMMLILHQLDAVRMRIWFLLRLNFFTAIVGYMVPFGALADGARAAVLWAETSVSPVVALEVSAQDRVLALLGFIVAGIVLTPFQTLADSTALDVVVAQKLFFWAAAAAIVLLALLARVMGRGVGPRWGHKLHYFVRRLMGNIIRPKYLVPQVVLAAVSNLSYALMLWFALRAIGVTDVSYWIMLTLTPALSISQNIPFFYLGWGSREAAAVVLLSTVAGVAPSQAVGASLLVGAGVFLASLPGLFFFAHFTRLRRAAQPRP